jgi:hypothetical protein
MLQSFDKILKILSIVILMFVNMSEAVSQEWNSARITILYGGNIPFNFNSLEKIKKGIEIVNGTYIGISMADSSKVGHDLEGFDLNFRSFNGQSNIKGDVYTLPLNKIRVKAENIVGLGSGFSDGYKDLTTDWVTLFSYTNTSWADLNWANHQLRVSYECGKPVAEGGNGSLIGEEPDYYNVEIEFELVPTGPGF